MSLIKFPTQIKPSRVTAQLQRTDEMFASPVTGIQQVASRGNAFWRWTYEFRDLSLSEREVVQAFLMKCRGSLNTFNITDPAQYEQLTPSMSSFVDLYSGRGQFVAGAGSDYTAAKINSYWQLPNRTKGHIGDDGILRCIWQEMVSHTHVQYQDKDAYKNELINGKSYLQRIKFFNGPKRGTQISFRVQSGSSGYQTQASPYVQSDDILSAPFYVNSLGISSYTIHPVVWRLTEGRKGDIFSLADYRLARCALVSNSENLLTYSNEFDNAAWVTSNMNVASGYGGVGPNGINSYDWALIPDTSVNTTHQIGTSISKTNSHDFYTFSFYARPVEASSHYVLHVRMSDTLASYPQVNYASVYFDIAQAVNQDPFSINATNEMFRPSATMYDVGSSWKRCTLTALSNSNSTLSMHITVCSKSSIPFTGTNSPSFLIRDAQLKRHPFAGIYVPTTGTVVVGTNWQTGSQLYVDGLDPGAIIKAGTRCEIINQFANIQSGTLERSEFKRVTEEIVVNDEGYAVLPIDPPIRNAPQPMLMTGNADNYGETMHNPVVFTDPEMKGRLLAGTIQYIEKPLQLTDIVFDVIEDLSE